MDMLTVLYQYDAEIQTYLSMPTDGDTNEELSESNKHLDHCIKTTTQGLKKICK
jgi:hypothetical protein